jgi:2-polyprenyl-3-methyl-5-hydroxy-6-metoxy-1,4-benzoquinol methylase
MTDRPFDQAKSDAFADKLLATFNNAALTLMISIGHQVRLFDAMADQPPATSQEIAEATGLNERYVREWLGAMVTGRVVDYQPAEHTYSLPPEHAAWLTRAAGLNNLAPQAQYIPLLAQVEEPIVECFRKGGGVPYDAFPRFHRVLADSGSAYYEAALVPTILPSIPGMVERLEAGVDAADIGCGSGRVVNLMARAFPQSRFVGYDFSEEAILAGRTEMRGLGLMNACFDVRDVTRLEAPGRYDVITAFDAIHDQAQPAQVLQGIAEALRPGGLFLMVDIGASSHVHENLDFAWGPFLYAISCMHCMTVSLALDGAGLGAMWGEQTARHMLAEAGFTQVEVRQVEGDTFNNYFIATKGEQYGYREVLPG